MEENRELNEPKALFIIARDFGNGSGFFVEEDLIATNIHVVAGATSISAKVVGANTAYTVEGVAAFDAKNDLVILKVAGEGMPLPIGDIDLLQSGDIVQSIGYPNGKYKITEGPIHSVRDSDKWIRMRFKTDSGNSGGPVLNGNGEVIGVAVADANCFSFATPVNAVKALLAPSQAIEPLVQWQKRKQIQAYAYLVQSKINLARFHYDDAIADLDKAIQLNPNCFLFYYNRAVAKEHLSQSKVEEGDVAEAQQHYQGAIADYMKAIKLCPDCAAAYSNRGTVKSLLGQSKVEEGNIAEAQQHYQGAIADLTEAIGLYEDFAIAYNNRADAKCRFGKSEDTVGNVETAQSLYQEAIIDINTAIELDANIAVFYHTRGQIKAALGDYSAAIKNYERVREMDPDYTDVCKDLELAKRALEQQEEGPMK